MPRTASRSAALGVAAICLVSVVSACMPITPSVAFQHSTFEGFPVISYVPEDPRGLIFVFHGTGGSADFAEKLDTVDVLNTFIAAGYGFVSTSSTERTGNMRWDAFDPSLTTNPDLARLLRLRDQLVATTGVADTTPLFGIGHSNGSRFVTLWGQTWSDAGLPVRAIWASAGRVAAPIESAGGLTVPTFFTAAANDFTVPPGGIVANYLDTAAAGTPAELHINVERTLGPLQYLRIPGVDGTEANAIVAALKATGVWDAAGTRVVADVEAATAQALTAVLPPSVVADGLANEVVNETAIVLAIHQFSPEFKLQAFAFFDSRVAT